MANRLALRVDPARYVRWPNGGGAMQAWPSRQLLDEPGDPGRVLGCSCGIIERAAYEAALRLA